MGTVHLFTSVHFFWQERDAAELAALEGTTKHKLFYVKQIIVFRNAITF
jgi:hypothetical protein